MNKLQQTKVQHLSGAQHEKRSKLNDFLIRFIENVAWKHVTQLHRANCL